MDNDNKQLNKTEQNQANPAGFNVSTVAVFNNNSNSFYIYKKTEKLVSAIYMISGFVSDREPMKWQLREAGVDLLAKSLNMSDRLSFVSAIIKLLSFLEVSVIAGVISEMNYKVLKFEFESLIQAIESAEKWSATKGLVLSNNFFEVAEVKSNSLSNNSIEPKGHSNLSDRVSTTSSVQKTIKTIIKDKSNRQEIIISLLKKNKELGIKDFVSSISNCSEKTVQRELATLISKGLIRKEGEKRWSRYSLK